MKNYTTSIDNDIHAALEKIASRYKLITSHLLKYTAPGILVKLVADEIATGTNALLRIEIEDIIYDELANMVRLVFTDSYDSLPFLDQWVFVNENIKNDVDAYFAPVDEEDEIDRLLDDELEDDIPIDDDPDDRPKLFVYTVAILRDNVWERKYFRSSLGERNFTKFLSEMDGIKEAYILYKDDVKGV